MENNVRKLWMPISKQFGEGGITRFAAILSDNSVDRDGERIGKALINQWAKNAILPALVNHENSMEKWIGGWKELKVIEKGGNTALQAEPFFFSEAANPLAARVEKQISEALENGLNAGISISAIPSGSKQVKVNGKMLTEWTEAELVEATFVPIQSNRNATFGHLAKQFSLEKEGTDNTTQIKEESKMTEEIKKQEEIQAQEAPVEVVAEEAPKEETKVEAPVEEAPAEEESKEEEPAVEEAEASEKVEPAEEEAPAEPEVEEPKEDVEAMKAKIAELTKAVESLQEKKLSGSRPSVEAPSVVEEETNYTFTKALKHILSK